MSALEYVLRDVTFYVDSKDMTGTARSIRLPKITEKSEKLMLGGNNFERSMRYGYEEMTCEWDIAELDPEVLAQAGRNFGNDLPMTAYGYMLGEQGQETNAEVYLRGRISEIDMGTWEPSKFVPLKWNFIPKIFRLNIAGRAIFDINIEARIFIVNGVDQNRNKRLLMGAV